jgi:soluble lytic murein transglycosylase
LPRHAIGTLICLALLGLSPELPFPCSENLPPVSTAPAAAAIEPRIEDQDNEDALLAAALAAHIASRQETGMTEAEIAEVAWTIVEEARRHDIDPALVMAVIHVESRYNAFAVSPAGAMGLMQVLPSTGEELAFREGIDWHGPQTLFDPVANIRLGVAYLNALTDRYGDTTLALAAYNWGPGHIDRRLRRGSPLPKVYPALVLKAYTAKPKRRS